MEIIVEKALPLAVHRWKEFLFPAMNSSTCSRGNMNCSTDVAHDETQHVLWDKAILSSRRHLLFQNLPSYNGIKN